MSAHQNSSKALQEKSQEKSPKPRTGTRQRREDVMWRETSLVTGQHYKEDRTEGCNQTDSTTGFPPIHC